MSRHLLPPNCTPLEAALADATAINIDPVQLRYLGDSTRCPLALLPWLAWERSVDNWDEAITEKSRRALIRDSIAIHQRKGTAGAVRRALAALGVSIEFQEWQATGGVPFTLQLTAWANDNNDDGDVVLSSLLYQRIKRVVDQTKNERTHYAFRVGARFDDRLRIGNVAGLKTLRRDNANALAVQIPPATQAIQLASTVTSRSVHHHSAEPHTVSVTAKSLITTASVARTRAVVHVTMEAFV